MQLKAGSIHAIVRQGHKHENYLGRHLLVSISCDPKMIVVLVALPNDCMDSAGLQLGRDMGGAKRMLGGKHTKARTLLKIP